MRRRIRSSGETEELSPEQQKLTIELCILLREDKSSRTDDPNTLSFRTCLQQECYNRHGPASRAAIKERLMDLLHYVQTGENKAFEFALGRLSLLAACAVHRPEIERKCGPRAWYGDQGAWEVAMNVLGLQEQDHGSNRKSGRVVEEDGEDILGAKKARKSGNFPGDSMDLLDNVTPGSYASRASLQDRVSSMRSMSKQKTPTRMPRQDALITPPGSAVSAPYGPTKPFGFSTPSFVRYPNSGVPATGGTAKPFELALSPLAQDSSPAVVPNGGLQSPLRPTWPLTPSPGLPVVANGPQKCFEHSVSPCTQQYPAASGVNANGPPRDPFNFSAAPLQQQYTSSAVVSSTTPSAQQQPTTAMSSTNNPPSTLNPSALPSGQPSLDQASSNNHVLKCAWCHSAAIWVDRVFEWCSTCLPTASADTAVPCNKCRVAGWLNVCGWCFSCYQLAEMRAAGSRL